MSQAPKPSKVKRLSINDITAMKGKQPVVALTAYTAPTAALFDPHVDLLLVGDSLGMVVYGMDSTLPVTLDMMINHTRAVVRGSQHALVVADMPFGTYQASMPQAFLNAARMLKDTGCAAIKLEGGKELAPTIRMLSERGIPVLSHIGLKPQHVHIHGGYKTQGKDAAAQRRILEDALACEEAGAFAVVIEATEEPLAREITARLKIPTIGIGASPACDGQVLVCDDMLGLFDFTPKFVQQFANLRGEISKGVAAYAEAVRARTFPTPLQCFGIKDLH